MDPTKFDDLTKALATSPSRRQALKTIAAATLGSILGLSGIGTAFAKCKPAGEKCNHDHQCCESQCLTCQNGKCASTCTSGQTCQNGQCVSTCQPDGAPCDFSNPEACCSLTCCASSLVGGCPGGAPSCCCF